MTNTQPVSSNTVQAGPIPVTLKLDSWTVFRTALDEAIVKIQPSYFRVPRYGLEAAWRERAYCYELYHLLRCQLPEDFPYTLHGEIDKIGHGAIVQHFGKMKRPNPDFILHNPGDMSDKANLVVVEVKRSDAELKLIKQDLWKIRKFIKHVGYQRGVMLFFGEQTPPDLFHLGGIEAIWHRVVGQKPMVSNKGKFT
jgi:hypothetical protein